MKIMIRGNLDTRVLMVVSEALCEITDWDPQKGPRCRIHAMNHSLLSLPGLSSETMPRHEPTVMPGPWLDNVVRTLGYEARRRRPRKEKS